MGGANEDQAAELDAARQQLVELRKLVSEKDAEQQSLGAKAMKMLEQYRNLEQELKGSNRRTRC